MANCLILGVISPLVLFLGIVGVTQGQYGTCDYEQWIEPGKSYYVFSPRYPANYLAGTNCRWTAKSDRPIRMKCSPFSIPESNRCSLDVVLIQTGASGGQRYCGTGELNLVSEVNQLVIALQSSGNSSAGRFFCTLQTADETKDSCNCGWKNPTRIVGGKETGINEYPMMAGLVDSINRILYCGVTIINNRQVVTAAHCLLSNRDPLQLGVIVGEHDLTTGRETNATRLFRIMNYASHPYYNPQTQDYDVAVVTVQGTIEFNQQVGPACLPFQHSTDTFAGNYVEILGWGTTDFAAAQSKVLQKAELAVITMRSCQRNYPTVTDRQLCTLEQGKDSCQFDSGGPVLWRDPTTKRIVLVGVISFGSICADGNPAVNTRIGAVLNWIYSQYPNYPYCREE